jgi:hypothetical protein
MAQRIQIILKKSRNDAEVDEVNLQRNGYSTTITEVSNKVYTDFTELEGHADICRNADAPMFLLIGKKG